MRKRIPIAIGGGIALLIASQYLDFGLGFQNGSGPGSGNQEQVSVDPNPSRPPDSGTVESPEQSDAVTPNEQAMRDAAAELENELADPPRPNVVDILIDGNQYLVQTQTGKTERKPMTLDQILAYAGTAPGNENGIRVRIARTPDAVAAAEASVMRKLSDAGLTIDQIDARRQLVERQ